MKPNTNTEAAEAVQTEGDPAVAPAATCSPSLRMTAYYYSFDRTGVEAIDRILCAVASAGKACHHTEHWADNNGQRDNCDGDTPVDWIQNAANAAAKFIQENVKDVAAAETTPENNQTACSPSSRSAC